MLDHAKSDDPKTAMCKMRAEKYRESGESLVLESLLGSSLSVLDKTNGDRLKVRFHICYLMAKQGLSFSKYLSLLELEAHHGIDLGLAYSTPNLVKTIIGYTTKSQRQCFINNFYNSNTLFLFLN